MKKSTWYLYMLECGDGSLYTGVTTDLNRRARRHRAGSDSRYVRSRGAKQIVYVEPCADRAAALRREYEIKGWSRQKKLSLVNGEG